MPVFARQISSRTVALLLISGIQGDELIVHTYDEPGATAFSPSLFE